MAVNMCFCLEMGNCMDLDIIPKDKLVKNENTLNLFQKIGRGHTKFVRVPEKIEHLSSKNVQLVGCSYYHSIMTCGTNLL